MGDKIKVGSIIVFREELTEKEKNRSPGWVPIFDYILTHRIRMVVTSIYKPSIYKPGEVRYRVKCIRNKDEQEVNQEIKKYSEILDVTQTRTMDSLQLSDQWIRLYNHGMRTVLGLEKYICQKDRTACKNPADTTETVKSNT